MSTTRRVPKQPAYVPPMRPNPVKGSEIGSLDGTERRRQRAEELERTAPKPGDR